MRTALTDLVGIEHPLLALNRSPGVVAAVTNAGGLGVLAATSYSPDQLDAQLRWIDEQVGGKPYGVDVLVPERVTSGDPGDVIASLRRKIPAEHVRFIEDLLAKYEIPAADAPAGRSG
jgi:NAD(P)H-dependent flavin oxidoreductase YrpB (nitropropane dioxygenase family)